MKEKIVNIPNALTAVRLLLAFPCAWAIYSGDYTIAIVIFFVAFLTDFLDGTIARRCNQSTEFGRILDPIADKTFVILAVLAIFFRGLVPVWFLGVIIGRDVLILLGGLYAMRRIHVVIPSNNFGRAAVVTIGLSLMVALLELPEVLPFAMALAVLMSVLSLSVYAVGMVRRLGESTPE